MQRIFMLCMAMCTILTGFAQVDSTGKRTPDTIKIGGMVIIREEGANYDTTKKGNKTFRINSRGDQPSNISTNWWIMDIGFSNYVDNTNYPEAISSGILAPGMNEENFKAKAGKSRNINIWVLMQRLNIIKHVVNLKYGLGVELNNYHFEDKRVKFNTNPTSVDTSYTGLDKNKLAADYITFPLMINFNFAPDKRKNFGFSAGVSFGYLYSARQKIKFDGDVDKTKSDFGMLKWKLSYIGEISLGPVKLYASYAFKSMFDNEIDLTPYNVGLRFSAW
ncbi:MAG TPA: outer membrane beta-barrel protein [Chitinophagaceae bacterium]|nr:outer membrane beta-barrel protein [Chitinophagaceae bacterium]